MARKSIKGILSQLSTARDNKVWLENVIKNDTLSPLELKARKKHLDITIKKIQAHLDEIQTAYCNEQILIINYLNKDTGEKVNIYYAASADSVEIGRIVQRDCDKYNLIYTGLQPVISGALVKIT